MRDASPLRYPGGKWRIAGFFEQLIKINNLNGYHYVEPYAGGASLGLTLLFKDLVSEIHLNDLDLAIHAFWHSILNFNKDFIRLLEQTEISPEEWTKQKSIYSEGIRAGKFALGFATFFLNRTNHSGILNAGMIGGKKQSGEWKIDARFNKEELTRRIRRVGTFKSRIHLTKDDALYFLRSHTYPRLSLKYLDPPYYRAGKHLYLNGYEPEDHVEVSRYIRGLKSPWVVSYDDNRGIRKLYEAAKSRRIDLLHTARSARIGREVLFFAQGLRIPRSQ